MLNNTRLRIPKKHERFIDTVTQVENGVLRSELWYEIELVPGFCRGSDVGVHFILEPTQKAALSELRDVVPCECEECLSI